MHDADGVYLSMSSTRDADFGDFVAAQSAQLVHYARLLTRDVQLAEDLVQEALIKVYLRWNSIQTSPLAYTRRAVLNQYLSGRRKRRVDEVSLTERESTIPTDDGAFTASVGLGALTERERAVLVLRFHLDLTEREAADMLGVAVGTVKSTCHRALGKLRRTLVQAEQEYGHE